jgi:hypothetical protein
MLDDVEQQQVVVPADVEGRFFAAFLHELSCDAARSGADVDDRGACRDCILGGLVAAGISR